MATQVVARYELTERLGGGGMATVYRGWDPRIRRHVAVKVMSGSLLGDPQFFARFDAEAHVAGTLQHEAIVPLYDYGEEQGVPYLVSPLLTGGTLSERLMAARPTLDQALDVLSRVAGALDHAHERGVIHRDVKPANILFDDAGRAYLADFGIAKILEGAPDLTGTGVSIGTPRYMSPEQSEGRPVSAATDIYALGIVAFEMATGAVPFNAPSTPSILYQHVHERPPLASSLNPALSPAVDAALNRALEKRPERRYARAAELVEALRAAIRDGIAPAPLPPPPIEVQLEPPSNSGRLSATYSVVLHNDGDDDALVDIQAGDEDNACQVRVAASAVVPGRSSVRVTVEVTPLKRRYLGEPREHPFSIAARARDDEMPTVAAGSYREVPVLHGAPRYAAIAIVGLLAGGLTFLGIGTGLFGGDGDGSNLASPDDTPTGIDGTGPVDETPDGSIVLPTATAEPPGAIPTSVPAQSITDIEWRLTGYGNPEALTEPLPGTTVTATFTSESGQVEGSTGCNTYGGPFEAEDGGIFIGSLEATLRGCEPAISEQEQEYLALLGDVVSYTVEGDRLSLLVATGEVLEFER